MLKRIFDIWRINRVKEKVTGIWVKDLRRGVEILTHRQLWRAHPFGNKNLVGHSSHNIYTQRIHSHHSSHKQSPTPFITPFFVSSVSTRGLITRSHRNLWLDLCFLVIQTGHKPVGRNCDMQGTWREYPIPWVLLYQPPPPH